MIKLVSERVIRNHLNYLVNFPEINVRTQKVLLWLFFCAAYKDWFKEQK